MDNKFKNDRPLSSYSVQEALELAGLKEGINYDRGNLGMGVAALAIARQVAVERLAEEHAANVQMDPRHKLPHLIGVDDYIRSLDMSDREKLFKRYLPSIFLDWVVDYSLAAVRAAVKDGSYRDISTLAAKLAAMFSMGYISAQTEVAALKGECLLHGDTCRSPEERKNIGDLCKASYEEGANEMAAKREAKLKQRRNAVTSEVDAFLLDLLRSVRRGPGNG